jgi:hypothetical protein
VTYARLPVEYSVNLRRYVCDSCYVVSQSAGLYKDGDFSCCSTNTTYQHHHITHHTITQLNPTTSPSSALKMVRLLTIVTVLFAGATSVAASYCQCLYADGSHCCVIVSRHVSLHTQAWLAHNCGVSRTTKPMTVRECARRHLRTVRQRDRATPAGSNPQLATGTLTAVGSVRHRSFTKSCNALAPSANSCKGFLYL